jgi:hypothetical protein
MSDYDHDQDPYDYDDDEKFYEESIYNEEYYMERQRELIRHRTSSLSLRSLRKNISGRWAKKAHCAPFSSSLEGASPTPKRDRRSISRRVKFLSEHNLKSSSA